MVPGVVPTGEGGLLGLALSPASRPTTALYAYFTAGDRQPDRPDDATTAAGGPHQRLIFSGIPKGPIHNGGRIAFGPDGMLYVGTGEAGDARAGRRTWTPSAARSCG